MNKKVCLLLSLTLLVIFCYAEGIQSFASTSHTYLLAQGDAHITDQTPYKLTYSQSYSKGKNDATAYHSSTGYFLGGVGAGLFLGLIGTAIIGFSAGGSQPDNIPDFVEPSGYQAGYFKKAKSSNQGAAWGGGLLGTAILVGIVVAASSGN